MNSFFSIMTIPIAISTTPMYSRCDAQGEVPAISSPEVTPTTTDTLTSCCNFTSTTRLTSIKPPHTIISPHCHTEGTTSSLAGKKIGNPMLQANRNWCTIVYSFDSLSLNISELTQPSMSPGRNYQSLVMEQFSSIRREPKMMHPKQSMYMFMVCPRVLSQNMANMSPPEPFHPMYMLTTIATKDTMHSNLSLLSRAGLGRYGYSQYLRITPIQFNRKAVRQVTNAYCSTGMPARSAIQKCAITRVGASNSIAGLLSCNFGSSAFSLYQKSCRSGCPPLEPAAGGTSLAGSMRSASSLFSSSDCCLLIL